MSNKLLTEHHLEFVRLKGGCTGSPESNCHILGNYMSRLIFPVIENNASAVKMEDHIL